MERENRALLVVEHNASMVFYLAMLLKRLGYVVTTVRSGEEALRVMEDVVPSLVLTEIVLPRMNGISLLKRVKETPQLKTIPVVVLTSETDPGMKDTCLRAGCAAYLNKPVEPDLLYRTLQSVSESVPRQNIRLNTSLKVTVGDGSVLGGTARTEYATAISEGGMYVRTLYPQPVNTLTPVSITLQDREIRAKAVVLYSFSIGEGPFKEPGMGMKFIEIAHEDQKLVKEYIKEQLTGDLDTSGQENAVTNV